MLKTSRIKGAGLLLVLLLALSATIWLMRGRSNNEPIDSDLVQAAAEASRKSRQSTPPEPEPPPVKSGFAAPMTKKER